MCRFATLKAGAAGRISFTVSSILVYLLPASWVLAAPLLWAEGRAAQASPDAHEAIISRAQVLGKEEALSLLDSLETSVHLCWYRKDMPDAYRADSLQFELGESLSRRTGDKAFLEVARASRKRFGLLEFGWMPEAGASVDREAFLDSLLAVREAFSRNDMKKQVIITDLLLGEFSTVFERADFPRALSYFLRALAMARETGIREWESHTLTSIGRVFQRLERYEEARGYFQTALEAAEDVGDKEAYFRALLGLVRVDFQSGDPGRALAGLEELPLRTGLNLQEKHPSLNFLYGDIRSGMGDLE